jgi:hypothetical protein
VSSTRKGLGDLVDVAAQRDLGVGVGEGLAGVVRIGAGEVPHGGLALRGHVRLEVVDVEHRLGRVFDAPDHHGGDVHRVAALVVDLELVAVQGAGAQADLVAAQGAAALALALVGPVTALGQGADPLGLGRRRLSRRAVGPERVAPVEAALLAGALVVSEQDEDARLVGLEREEAGAAEDGEEECHAPAADEPPVRCHTSA